MDIKATASLLLAKSIAARIGQTRIGLLANALPPFDPVCFCEKLQVETTIPLRIGLLGFGELVVANNIVTQSVETVIGWRNDLGLSTKMVVILNPQVVQEKVHSLHMLEPFSDSDLYNAICQQAEIEALRPLEQKLWHELNQKGILHRHQLVAEQVITLYVRLRAGEEVGLALPAIDLLPDGELQIHENQLSQRLGRNRELVKWLNALDSSGMRTLARALSNNESSLIAATFRYIKAYRAQPDNLTFSKLSVQVIEAIKIAPKLQPKPKSKTTFDRSSASDALVATLLTLSIDDVHRDEKLAKLRQQAKRSSDLFEENVHPNYDDDIERVLIEQNEGREQESTEVILYGDSHEETIYSRPTEKDKKHPLEEHLFRWVHFDCWGGVLSLDVAPDHITNVSDLLASDQVQPTFLPRKPEYKLHPLLRAMDELVISLPVRTGEPLITLFERVKDARNHLIPYRNQFLYYPLDANFNPDLEMAIADYLLAYQLLAQQLQAVCRVLQPANPVAVENATALFLALDSVLAEIVHREQQPVYSAILTPLHPLHLWKWQKLHDALLENHVPLSEKAGDRVQEAVRNLPTLLNTFVLHTAMFADEQQLIDTQLVFTGVVLNEKAKETVGIPYYTPIATHLSSSDGIEQFAVYLRRFLVLYPSARLGLTLVLIDPPQLTPILKTLTLLKLDAQDVDDQPLLYGATVLVYRRSYENEAHEAWTDNDEPTLQLFREDPHWQLRVHLEPVDNYRTVMQDLTFKPHIILVCDPSDTVMVSIDRRTLQTVTPFSLPEQITYDSITDTIKIEPFPNGDVFDHYFGVRHILSGETPRIVHGVGRKTIARDLQELLQHEMGGQWLVIIDQPQGTLQLPRLGKRLLWRAADTRTLALHITELDWNIRWHRHLHNELNSLELPIEYDTTGLLERLLELFPVLPDGLLTLVLNTPNETTYRKPFDQTILRQMLGVMAMLTWYRHTRPGLVVIKIDEAFGDWYEPNESNAHYLALWLDDGRLNADIVFLESRLQDFRTLRSLSAIGQDLAPLTEFAITLADLYMPHDQLITPLRQTLLHRRLVEAVFGANAGQDNSLLQQTRVTKKEWANAIDRLFIIEMRPRIQIVSITVALYEAGLSAEIGQSYTPDGTGFERTNIKLPAVFLNTLPLQTVVSNIVASTEVEPIQIIPPLLAQQLLSTTSENPIDIVRSQVEHQAAELRRVLIAYGIAIAGVDTDRTQIGARFVRYWVRLQPPVGRLSELQKYAGDVARELGSMSVPLIGNIPGERYVGVDLPLEAPQTVFLINALAQLPIEQPYGLQIAFGQNVAGEPVIHDLSRLPHMLVAGHTGGGKSVFLASLIMSLVWRHSAETLKLILVDPKLMDFPVFETLPHLHNGAVIYDPAEAIELLHWLVEDESLRRAQIMQDAGVRKIESYYRHYSKATLPQIVVVIDEFADIMNSLGRKEKQTFEQQINRLAATGRARGIHLVLATQRPTVEIISGAIKANIPARVSFQLPTQLDSRTILDCAGAESLLGSGDMLLSINGNVERLQGYFASDEELAHLVAQRS